MAKVQSDTSIQSPGVGLSMNRMTLIISGLLLITVTTTSVAQEVRYSWLDISFMGQDVDKFGTKPTPVPGQTVDANAKDGGGIRFRGSVGTWHNLYMFIDYGSTDIDVDVIVTNPIGEQVPGTGEFDYTTIRSGFGVRFPVGFKTDIYAEVSYDSLDFDFGSFAGEVGEDNFSTDDQDVGGALGVRSMLTDNLELRAYGRYTELGDIGLSSGTFDADTLFGAGFGWTLVRGLSIVGDFESGELSSWSIGFRMDLDED